MSGKTIEIIQRSLLGAALLAAMGYALFERHSRPVEGERIVNVPLALPHQAHDRSVASDEAAPECHATANICVKMDRDTMVAQR